jgi:hypothetical protein
VELFWKHLTLWSEHVFGPTSKRGPVGPLKHLAKEVQETLQSPHDIEEYADMMHLVFDACRRAGFKYADLQEACFDKLSKNKDRSWPKAVADEPCEHLR